MKYISILFLSILLAFPVFAADLEWTINSTAGTVTFTGPTITDVNMDRFLDYLWVAYPQLDGNGDPLPRNNANEAQAFRDWATDQWRDTKSAVIRYERRVAADAAEQGVGDLE